MQLEQKKKLEEERQKVMKAMQEKLRDAMR